ncbi:hypothetical protein PGIGA_G00057390 [Pangasianodon gigas]|uniref:Uncharacterized protein n=1 Tax=Pangasianodon gigas TaxID=30993 RepID=A0ACC5X3T9_PANGG|nr:hypothetical protein [Pangasianodon gigas]
MWNFMLHFQGLPAHESLENSRCHTCAEKTSPSKCSTNIPTAQHHSDTQFWTAKAYSEERKATRPFNEE